MTTRSVALTQDVDVLQATAWGLEARKHKGILNKRVMCYLIQGSSCRRSAPGVLQGDLKKPRHVRHFFLLQVRLVSHLRHLPNTGRPSARGGTMRFAATLWPSHCHRSLPQTTLLRYPYGGLLVQLQNVQIIKNKNLTDQDNNRQKCGSRHPRNFMKIWQYKKKKKSFLSPSLHQRIITKKYREQCHDVDLAYAIQVQDFAVVQCKSSR